MTRNNLIILSVLLAYMVLNAQQLNAQQTKSSEIVEETKSASITFTSGEVGKTASTDVRKDFLVPTSPAFSVLGISPEEVVRPESPRELGMAILNGTDEKGNFHQGIALDFVPYELIGGAILADYRMNRLDRILSRTQLSIATSKGSDEADNTLRAAVGLRMTLMDWGDPRRDSALEEAFTNEITAGVEKDLAGIEAEMDNLSRQLTAAPPPSDVQIEVIELELAKLQEKRAKIAKDTQKKFAEKWANHLKENEAGNWNATSFAFGLAPVFFSESGESSDLESDSFTVYCTLSYGFDWIKKVNENGTIERQTQDSGAASWLQKNTHLLLHARYADKEQEVLSDGSGTREQDALTLGAQLRILGPNLRKGSKKDEKKKDDFVLGVEVDYIDKEFAEGGGEDSLRWAIISEIKPFKESPVSVKIAAGSENGNDDGETFVTTSLNFGF
jgi:hypothetical protein